MMPKVPRRENQLPPRGTAEPSVAVRLLHKRELLLFPSYFSYMRDSAYILDPFVCQAREDTKLWHGGETVQGNDGEMIKKRSTGVRYGTPFNTSRALNLSGPAVARQPRKRWVYEYIAC